MKNIEVYFGDILIQKFIWDNSNNIFNVKDCNKFVYFNPISDANKITKEELEKELSKRFRMEKQDMKVFIDDNSNSKDYSIWAIININHLICANEFIWIKYEDDDTTWNDIALEYNIKETEFQRIIDGTQELFNRVLGD